MENLWTQRTDDDLRITNISPQRCDCVDIAFRHSFAEQRRQLQNEANINLLKWNRVARTALKEVGDVSS
jgi:hypothetical protein